MSGLLKNPEQVKVQPFVYKQVPAAQPVLVAVDPTGTFGVVKFVPTRVV